MKKKEKPNRTNLAREGKEKKREKKMEEEEKRGNEKKRKKKKREHELDFDCVLERK